MVATVLSEMQNLADANGTFLGNRKAVSLGAVFGDLAERDCASGGCYDGIPTMVTPRELRLLHNFFSVTPLEGPVLEIGPYLGGSTAAIAYGLAKQKFENIYYTIDAFGWPYPAFRNILQKDFETLGGEKKFGSKISIEVSKGNWIELFRKLHEDKPYYQFLKPIECRVPSDAAKAFHFEFLKPGTKLSAVFVDGFKTWASAYNAMKGLQPHLGRGAYLIFQDYSWIDCYWLPIMTAILGNKLRLVMKVDNTAVFQVRDSNLSEGIETFSAQASKMSVKNYKEILSNAAKAQFHSGDEVGFLCHTAQTYVLLHTLEQKAEAADTLRFMTELCERLNCNWLIEALSKSDFTVEAA